MNPHYPGKRISFNHAVCTVRYSGRLPDQNGDWLGVEWDEPDRGKHDGEYKGERLFSTLSPSPKSASFIRATRVPDEPRSFLQALRYKYAEDGLERTTAEPDGSIEISGKVVEEVGFERIRQQQALLHELKIVLLDGLRIRGLGARAEIRKVQDEIENTCPGITELDLSRNLFEHWKDIVNICASLTKLRVLKASGLRLMTFDAMVSTAFQTVKELHLNDSLLRPDQILDMLCKWTDGNSFYSLFPSLYLLSMAGNKLSTFHSAAAPSVNRVFPTIKTIVLDMNAFSSLVPLCASLMPLFPNLATLSLQHNHISAFNSPASTSEEPLPVYSSITTLNLSHNAITTPAIISSLSQLFPNLTSLRVSGNPFFSSNRANSTAHRGTEDAAFMLTLARLPTLTMLNYSAITDKDRMDGELYYLSVAENEIQTAFRHTESLGCEEFTRAKQDWGRYGDLCSKYERENLVEKLAAQLPNPTATSTASSQKPKYPPNSLGARLITVTFHFHPTSNENTKKEDVVLTLPRTLDVYRVKSLLMRKTGRQWGLQPLGFVFELLTPSDGEDGDGVEEIPDSTRRIGDWITEGVGLGGVIVRVVPKPTPRLMAEGEEGVDLDGQVQRMDLSSLTSMMTV